MFPFSYSFPSGFPIGRLPCATALLAIFAIEPPVMAAQALIQEFAADHAGASLGNSIAIGDVDADGTDDWIVGIRNGLNGSLTTGAVRVYSGVDGSVLHDFLGTQGNSAFGFAVDCAGDVDADGFQDVIVGAPFHQEPGQILNGAAFVFSGQTGSLLHSFHGLSFQDSFGFSVCGLEDVNFDGRDDVAVGVPGRDQGGFDNGSVVVFSGLTGMVLLQRHGFNSGDLLGSSLTSMGDVDGDTCGDFAVGARGRDGVFVNSGSVTMVSGLIGVGLYEKFGTVNFQAKGYSLAKIPDLNGDGLAEWITGSPFDSRGASQAGGFQVHSGLDGTLIHDEFSSAVSENLGETVAGGPDVDGDGTPDWLVSAPGDSTFGNQSGRLQLHSGANASVVCAFYGSKDSERLGLGAAIAPDFNGDQIPDIALGIPGKDSNGSGAGSVQLVSGCRPQGTSYCSPAPINSVGRPGRIHAMGSDVTSHNQLTLLVEDLPQSVFGFFLAGESAGFVPNAGGSQGHLCLGGFLGRYNDLTEIRQSGPFGEFQLTIDLTAIPLAGSPAVQAGETWHFQAWYRDNNPGPTSNFTDGVAVTFW